MKIEKLNIILSKYVGFCSGVTRAVSILYEAKRKYGTNEILGQLIHNRNFLEKLQKQGFYVRESIDEIRGKSFVVRAHGISNKILKSAIQRGLQSIDATCPVVKQVYDFAMEADQKGNPVIFFGNPTHPEIRGASDSLENPPISIKEIKNEKLKMKNKNVTLIAQTTASVTEFQKVSEELKKTFSNIDIKNTICQEALQRQEETQKVAADITIIVGSAHSANTQRLFEKAKNIMEAHLIEDSNELNLKVFEGKKTVFITSGTSTPIEDVMQVFEMLKNT